MVLALIGALVVIGVLLVAAQRDLTSFTIPNLLSLILVGSFFGLSPFLGLGWSGIASHVGVAAITLLVCVILFALGLYGGGDAKLTPSVVLWLGPSATPQFLMAMVIAGGALALILLVARSLARGRIRGLKPLWLRRMLRVKRGIPYGIAIALGGIVALPAALWFAPLNNFMR